MIHQYKNNGYNIVLDVNSGAVHVVDELCYDVIACLNRQNEAHTWETLKEASSLEFLKKSLGDRYIEKDLKEALEDVTELAKAGQLFVPDCYECLGYLILDCGKEHMEKVGDYLDRSGIIWRYYRTESGEGTSCRDF